MKAVWIGLGIFFALILGIVRPEGVGAAGNWEIGRIQSVSFNASPYCPTYRQWVTVDGFQEKQEACLFSGRFIRTGSFFADGGASRVAVMLPFDSNFRLVEGVCQGAVRCVYSPEGDVLISWSASGVSVFERVLERIRPEVGSRVYRFDYNLPEYKFEESIGAVGVSRNGKWLVVEVKNKGIDLINLEIHERRRIISPGVLYGYGRNPREEIAVSNDGSYVAVMGEHTGFTLVKVQETCENTCEVVMANTAAFTPAFNFAFHPVFDSSGKRLTFYTASFGQGTRRVEINQEGYAKRELSYLALGDSFSSGEGEIDDWYYRPGTNNGHERCHLSIRSYPFLLAARLGISSSSVQSVACAGARMVDIISDGSLYEGQSNRLGLAGLELSKLEQEVLRAETIDTFFPGRIHQADFLEHYYPDVVTIGVGGNDAGLMGKLKTCAMPGVCEWVSDPAYLRATAIEIQGLFERLKDFYGRLKEEASSIFYAVGYPQIIDPEGLCDPMTATLLTHEERVFVTEGIRYLNTVIKAAAESRGLIYLDIEQALDGHRLCSGTPDGMNGLRIGDDVVIHQNLPMIKLIGSETFHPTPSGHTLIANTIYQLYGDIRVRRQCVCTMISDPPEIPPYWGEMVGESRMVYSAFMSKEEIVAPDITVSLPPGMLEPNSTVTVALHSTPHVLGELIAGIDGSVSGTFTLPTDTVAGYHTLHLFGASRNFLPVDLYQTILYDPQLEEEHRLSEIPSIRSDDDPSLSAVLGVSMIDIFDTTVSRDDSPMKSHGVSHQKTLTLEVLVYAVALIIFLIVLFLFWKTRTSNSSQDPGG